MHREPDARRAPAADQPAADAAAPSAEQAADDAFLLCRDQAMLELFYCSGLRLIELSALDCAQLDLDAGRLRVAGRGGLCRDLPLARAARQALQAWLQQRATCAAASPALFVARNGQRLTARAVQQRVRRAGIARLQGSPQAPLGEPPEPGRAAPEWSARAADFQHLAQVYRQAHPRARRAAAAPDGEFED